MYNSILDNDVDTKMKENQRREQEMSNVVVSGYQF
jgi:hypothetical protein